MYYRMCHSMVCSTLERLESPPKEKRISIAIEGFQMDIINFIQIITTCLLQFSQFHLDLSFKINIPIVRTVPPTSSSSPLSIISTTLTSSFSLFSSLLSPRPHKSFQPASYLSFTP